LKAHRRSGLSAVLSAVILFAMIFTVGSTFFIFINNENLTVNQANSSAQAKLQAASVEELSLEAHLSSTADQWAQTGDLWISVNNTGGVASTIDAVYVSNTAGQLVSESQIALPTVSHYLSTDNRCLGSSCAVKGDLNETLPLTVPVGGSTNLLNGCSTSGKVGCNIGISKSAYDYTSGNVIISVLTASGKIFSATYPPPIKTTTTQVTVDSVTSTTTLISKAGEGNALDVQLSAAPNQVFSGATITVTAEVYSYESTAVTGASLTMNTPEVTGTASVTVASACTPTGQTLPSFSGTGTPSPVSFTCTYTSSTGSTGGFASFSGYVQGTLGTSTLTSAEAISNTVQIGGAASVTTQGAFTTNFFFFRYSACTNAPNNSGTGNTYSYSTPCTTTPSSMPPSSTGQLEDGNFISGGGDYYTAYYVELTNDFNATVPILEYSYLFLDPGISGEQYNFLVGTGGDPSSTYYPNYGCTSGCSNDIPALTAYTGTAASCSGSPPPASCIDVAPDQTVTLTFAACGWGSSSWSWGGTQDAASYDPGYSGCTASAPSFTTPEGFSLVIVVSYLYDGNVYSQSLPFEGQIMLRSTSTSPSCSPSTFLATATTTCTATVTDTDGGGSYITPTGTVDFTSSPGTAGAFSPTACTLSGSGDSESCTSTFTPAAGYDGTPTITASYQGDGTHYVSSGSTTVTVEPIVTTLLSTSSITAGNAVTDSATLSSVTATAGGTLTYYYSTTNSCPTSGATDVGSVTVTNGVVPGSPAVTFNTAGTYYWYAVYGGDANNPGSTSSCEPLIVTKASPTISTSLTSSSITAGTSAVDTATLSGGTTIAGGSVTYYYYSGTTCGSGSSTTVGTVAVTNHVVPNSPGVTMSTVGTYYWDAVYSGDGGNNGATSPCETLTVTKASPTIAAALSATPVTAGTSVTDSATLSADSGSNTGGTVKYYWYTSSSCTTGSTLVSTVTVTGGTVPNSASVQFNTVGTFYWNAVYSGDSNNNAVTSSCQTLTVNKASPTLTSTFTAASPITAGTSESMSSTLSPASATAGGTVTYAYYSGSACTGTKTTVGSAVTVTNDVVPNSASVTLAAGTYYWQSSYSGDSNDNTATSTCQTLTVSKATPSLTTAFNTVGGLPAGTVTTSGSVVDTVAMTGGVETPSGSVTFDWYTGSSCSGTATALNTLTLSGGSIPTPPDSTAKTFATAGLYSYKATYTGDTNNNAVSSACEPLSVISLTLSPTSAAPGATVTLGGAGYSTSTTYSYCLTTNSAISGCVAATEGTFSGSGATGTISGTSFKIPNGQGAATDHVIVYLGSTILDTATETVT
jgi:hypothetical protein